MSRTLADMADARDDSLVEIAHVSGEGSVAWRLREIGFCAGARPQVDA